MGELAELYFEYVHLMSAYPNNHWQHRTRRHVQFSHFGSALDGFTDFGLVHSVRTEPVGRTVSELLLGHFSVRRDGEPGVM